MNESYALSDMKYISVFHQFSGFFFHQLSV